MATSTKIADENDEPESTDEPAFEQKVMSLLDEIGDMKLDYVRFTFADLHGVARCKSVPCRYVGQYLRSGGVTLFCGAVGFVVGGPQTLAVDYDDVVQARHGNVFVRPVLKSIHHLPWATDGKFRVGQLLCETFWSQHYLDGAPQAVCPRLIARGQLSRLRGLGYHLKSGFEAEFSVFRTADCSTPLFDGYDVFTGLLLSEVESLLYTLESELEASGVDILTVQTEWGPGHLELTLAPAFGVAAGDAMFRLREAVKEMCSSEGLFATFMAKPTHTGGTNGLHFNHSLWSSDGERNEFYVESETSRLSKAARQWLGGLVKHGPALTALCAPTVNCYRRLHHGSAPMHSDWGVDDRRKAFRVLSGAPESTYVENRIPSGSANPYIVLASTVAAGIDGLQTGRVTDEDLDSGAQLLPATLDEALDALEKDTVLVDALGSDVINWFVRAKREWDIEQLKNVEDVDTLATERQLYFKFL